MKLTALRNGLLALMLAALVPAAPALADERILDFHSNILIAADSGMQVEETIRVRADGTRIKHGIVREFPTRYHDAAGNPLSVGFEVLAAERDGHAEKWRSEAFENGVRVYFGDAARIVPAGDYKYTLRYRTTRQLGFFADHDELYWNVTGTGWNFPIDHAGADVTLPGTIAPDQIRLTGFTGPQDAKGRNYRASANGPSHSTFETTAPLARRDMMQPEQALGLEIQPLAELQEVDAAARVGRAGHGEPAAAAGLEDVAHALPGVRSLRACM